jgi:hypothetical protein
MVGWWAGRPRIERRRTGGGKRIGLLPLSGTQSDLSPHLWTDKDDMTKMFLFLLADQ